tara:strand:+ start:454 stop:780 length:327 start_codon:yes stop_codon:yes gene_type:complete
VAKRRQLALIKLEDPDDRTSQTVPLGKQADFEAALAPFNTATDGGTPKGGSVTFYGPGLVIEIVPMDGLVRQALVYCQNEDFAFPILYRVCRANGWKLQDMESGQMFG